MNKIRTVYAAIVMVSLALSGSGVAAQDFEKGLEAAQAGDFSTALKEWRPLAGQGDASAQYNLGVMYNTGRGVPQDYAEAVKWYRMVAEQGFADAQHNLGGMYRTGRGVPQDYAEAVKWYRMAAEQGHDSAQYNLGVMYDNGRGVPQNYVMAHMWFNIASTSGAKGRSREARDAVAEKLTAADISKAQTMATRCMGSNYTDCGE